MGAALVFPSLAPCSHEPSSQSGVSLSPEVLCVVLSPTRGQWQRQWARLGVTSVRGRSEAALSPVGICLGLSISP